MFHNCAFLSQSIVLFMKQNCCRQNSVERDFAQEEKAFKDFYLKVHHDSLWSWKMDFLHMFAVCIIVYGYFSTIQARNVTFTRVVFFHPNWFTSEEGLFGKTHVGLWLGLENKNVLNEMTYKWKINLKQDIWCSVFFGKFKLQHRVLATK